MVRMSHASVFAAAADVDRPFAASGAEPCSLDASKCAAVLACTSSSSASTSSSRSPMPTMMPVLATSPCSFTRRRSSSDRSNLALGRTAGYMRRTVSRLWLMMCGRASMTIWSAPQLPSKSGMSTSMLMPGQASFVRMIVSAQIPAPPSCSSSRLTLVMTMCLRPAPCCMMARLSATRRGSSLSSVGGRPVLTLQKPQARVQVSPRIMMVATPRDQHSPMLGQPASSQTVKRRFSLRTVLSLEYSAPPGTLARSHEGLRFTAIWSFSPAALLRIMPLRLTIGGSTTRSGSPPSGRGCRARTRARVWSFGGVIIEW